MTTPSRSNTVADIKDFTRAMLGDTLARMSGPLSVPAAIAALWVSSATAKILLGVLAFVSLLVTAYRLWKSEHDKVVERDQTKRQLLDEIAELRQTAVRYRIEMEADDAAQRFDKAAWQTPCRAKLPLRSKNLQGKPKPAPTASAAISLAKRVPVAQGPSNGTS